MQPLNRSYLGCPRARDRNGVNLIELTIGLGLLAIMASVAVPRYIDGLTGYRIQVAAKRLADDLQWTQRAAKQTASPQSITIDPTQHRYQLSHATSPTRRDQPYQIRLDASPYHVQIVDLQLDPPAEAAADSAVTLHFNRFGQPDQAMEVTLRAGQKLRTISVASLTGKVHID